MANLDYDKILEGIRKALYGYEVREYIAQSMEWTKAFVTQSVTQIKEYLRQAEAARDAAKASQDAAKVSETNAKASENAAASSASAAAGSASAAKTSENAAKTSEGNAKASENEARKLVEAAKKVVNTDKTLTIDGAPADAKIVGDKFKSIKTDWNSVTDKPSTFPPSEHTHSYITNGGDATAITGAIGTPGLSLQQAYNNGYPTTYGNVLSIGGTGDGQILAGWSGSNNGIERLYYRNRRDMCGTWSAWKAIAFTDDSNALSAYPVGAIYISTSSTSPASLFGGTWESIASERVLMGVSSSHGAGSTVSAGLPNITGVLKDLFVSGHFNQSTGVFKRSYCSSFDQQTDRSDWLGWAEAQFYASDSNSIYGNASTVQPAAYYVYMWRRTA
jgi:hypothetical protein